MWPEQHFANCSDLTHTATSYLKALVPHWKRVVKKAGGNPGCPVILIICCGGLRAVQFIRFNCVWGLVYIWTVTFSCSIFILVLWNEWSIEFDACIGYRSSSWMKYIWYVSVQCPVYCPYLSNLWFLLYLLCEIAIDPIRNCLVILLLVCVSFTIIGQPRNSVLIRRV